jgi:hypothetical protein
MQYIEKIYGFPCHTIERQVVLAAGVRQRVIDHNPNRVICTPINLGAGVSTIAFNGDVAAAYGIQLAAAGGWRSFSAKDDGELPTHEFWGFSAAGTTLYILETVASQ